MKKLLRIFYPDIEKGVRLISIATSIRWFGWGFTEAFLPVFLFSFAHTYAETGLLRSIYSIVFLLSLPIISWLADNIPSKKLLIVALLLYPLISISYFSAGALGVVAFVICARMINGVAYALDSVGRSTYIRSHAKSSNIATSFGYIESIANFWWLSAVFISALLVKYVPVHYLFLAIIPTSLIAIIFIRQLPNKINNLNFNSNKSVNFSLFGSYSNFFKIIISWKKKVRWLALLLFFVGIITMIGEFFIPIYAYTQHEGLGKVMLLIGFATLPYLLSSLLGSIVDKYKHTIFWACGLTAILLFILSFVVTFLVQLLLVFLIGICLQLLSLAVDREVTFQIPKKNIGSVSGAFQGISQISEIAGPIILGVAIDLFNMQSVLLALGCLALIVAGIYFNFTKKKLRQVRDGF